MATLLRSGELYSSVYLAKITLSEWITSHMCSFHRAPYIQDRESRRCHADDYFSNEVNLTSYGTSTNRCQAHIEEALIPITTGRKQVQKVEDAPICNGAAKKSAGRVGEDDSAYMPVLIDDSKQQPPPRSRRRIDDSMESRCISGIASASGTFDVLERSRSGQGRGDVSYPENWATGRSGGKGDSSDTTKPSWVILVNVKVAGHIAPVRTQSPTIKMLLRC